MKLIILNGPPGVGKSTISARLHTELPSSVLIDIDELRRTIPNYREQREESLHLAYELTVKAIEDALRSGHHVIIDKAISYTDTLESFIEAAKKHKAEIYEFILFADKATVQQRADERGYKLGGLLTPERVGEMWEKADALQKQRPDAFIIDTTHSSIEEVFSKLNEVLQRPRLP